MAVRVRKDGRVFCAAKHPEEPGDTYLHDGLHYMLSAELHVLVTDADHLEHGEWWWANAVPAGIVIDRWWAQVRFRMGDGIQFDLQDVTLAEFAARWGKALRKPGNLIEIVNPAGLRRVVNPRQITYAEEN